MSLPFVIMSLSPEVRAQIEATFKAHMDAPPTPYDPAAIPPQTEECTNHE